MPRAKVSRVKCEECGEIIGKAKSADEAMKLAENHQAQKHGRPVPKPEDVLIEFKSKASKA